MRSVNAYVEASDVTADMRVETVLVAADSEGNAVPDVYLNRGTAEITVPVKSSKSIPVSQETTGELPAGYAVEKIGDISGDRPDHGRRRSGGGHGGA